MTVNVEMQTIPMARAAFLVDADNFHDGDQLHAAYEQYTRHAGKAAICHVHGAEHILHCDNLKPVWREMAARLFPCLPLRKNTTDAALICDALILHFHHGVTQFGICSGDADFAPLALQLRELGCEVICFARMSIAFSDMTRFYDKVVRFDVAPATQAQTPSAAIPGTTTQVTGLVGSGSGSNPGKASPSQSSRPLAAKPQKGKTVNAAPKKNESAPSQADVEIVKKILAAVPDWSPHTVRQLNQLGSPLRAARLNPNSKPLHQLFRKYPLHFTVLPLDDKPRSVRLERRP